MARVLLIVGGGIAAYKSLELVRLLKKAGHEVTPVLKGGEHFVTAMSLGALAEAGPHVAVGAQGRGRDRSYPALPRGRLRAGVPGDCRPAGENGGGDRRRPCDHPTARDRQASGRRPAMNVRMRLHPATAAMSSSWSLTGSRSSSRPKARWRAASLAPVACPSPTRSSTGSARTGFPRRQVSLAGKHILSAPARRTSRSTRSA